MEWCGFGVGRCRNKFITLFGYLAEITGHFDQQASEIVVCIVTLIANSVQIGNFPIIAALF